MKYISYLLSMLVVLTLKYIIPRGIFVSGDSEEHRNSALNVVGFPFSHHYKKIESIQSDGLLNTSPILSGVGGFLGRLLGLFPISCMSLI